MNASALRREFDRIREQVPEDLLKPFRVGENRLCFVRYFHNNANAPSRSRGLDRVHRGMNYGARFNPLRPDLQISGDDPGDIEQIIDQLHLGLQISIDHIDRFRSLSLVEPAALQHIDPAEDRRQWCPEFMGQCCQKFVLHPVGLLKLFVSLRQRRCAVDEVRFPRPDLPEHLIE